MQLGHHRLLPHGSPAMLFMPKPKIGCKSHSCKHAGGVACILLFQLPLITSIPFYVLFAPHSKHCQQQFPTDRIHIYPATHNPMGMRIFAMFGIIATTFLYSECRQANDLWHALRQKQTTPQELIAQTPYFIHEPEFQSRIGKACIQQKYYPETIRLLEKSAHLRPTVEMLCDLGTAYRKTGDKQKAEQCFQTAIDMIPSRMLARYRLFCLYRDNGETQKAQQTAQEILTQKAKVVNSVTLNIKQEARKYYEHINP